MSSSAMLEASERSSKSEQNVLRQASWSVAAANGFDDGEKIPFEEAHTNLERIV
jgi:hypothetical protein